ncbi:beta-glucosidase-10 [Coleophoma crateriformis]|uniref:beta-glucosidase n=1 Tax=Coleophoma crateriformis TaxID=565419 RepID=A0A3D8Q771_9HELO|nr:beta-glucosidase-10 [Coleophoma crateriformis]
MGSTVDIEGLISQLTLEEKISLLAGQNFWETVPVPRLNIPSLKVSDGPNGARGAQFKGGVKAACFPASVSLAATWDQSLPQKIGNALAEETISKGAYVLLAPTVCPHRSPLGGRNFESFSEDPFLAGQLATSYIIGLQEKGVGATIKHFVANEQETRRFTMNVNVSERALREIYLKPFEIAIKKAEPWALMTSYNLVNGTHADLNEHLLQTILREQWGFKGLVMSDWGGTNSCAESITAGLDLEMPGPANRRKMEDVKKAISSGTLQVESIDGCVRAIMKLLEKTGKFAKPETPPEQAISLPAHQKLIREAGAQGIVLLKNENNILPLKKSGVKSIAALGLAKECLAHGGGSAAVSCHYKITPYEALERTLGKDVDLRFAQGAKIFRNLPDMVEGLFSLENKPGLTLSRYDTRDFSSTPEVSSHDMGTYIPLESRCEAARLEGVYRPTVTGSHYLSFSSLGPSKFLINDKVVLETTKNSDDSMGFLLGGVVEEIVSFDFVAGEEYKIRLETVAPKDEAEGGLSLLEGLLGIHLGFMLQSDYEADLLTDAVEIAKTSDIALIFVGNTPVWETEGQDMTTMSLPANGSQDALIKAVCEVNSNVIIINSTGVAISMPWLSSVSAMVQTWFPGQEAGNSIVDVLFGDVNPGGKLPISIPHRIEDTPAYGNFPGDVDTLQVTYQEGVEIGYRFYDKKPERVLFPFGFGLSYSNFEISSVTVEGKVLANGGTISVSADVKNVEGAAGHEVVQVYIAPLNSKVDRPIKTLAGFAKVALASGESKTAQVSVSYESAAFWDETLNMWKVEEGDYEILVGNSSANIVSKEKITVEETFTYGP